MGRVTARNVHEVLDAEVLHEYVIALRCRHCGERSTGDVWTAVRLAPDDLARELADAERCLDCGGSVQVVCRER